MKGEICDRLSVSAVEGFNQFISKFPSRYNKRCT